jgi:hypothetical protein
LFAVSGTAVFLTLVLQVIANTRLSDGSLLARSTRLSPPPTTGDRFPGSPPDASTAMRLPDGQRMLRLTGSYYMELSSDDVDETAVLAVPKGIQSLVGVTPDYRLVGSSFPSSPINRVKGTIEFMQWGINGNLTTERRSKATVPPNGDLRTLSLSPQGDRLLWTLQFRRPLRGTGRLISRFPGLLRVFPLQRSVAVYISDVDGANLRPVAELGIPDARLNAPPAPEPTGFHWSPDGKAIRFTYKNEFYSLPAPQ